MDHLGEKGLRIEHSRISYDIQLNGHTLCFRANNHRVFVVLRDTASLIIDDKIHWKNCPSKSASHFANTLFAIVATKEPRS